MSEPAPSPAAEPAAPAAAPAAVATSDLVSIGGLTPEAAREQIASLIHDKDFGKLLMARDPDAMSRWSQLHKAGHPAPQAVASADDVNAQAAARNAEVWDLNIAHLKTRLPLSATQENEIRSGVVDEQSYRWAQEEKARVIKDRAFYKRLMDGEQAANTQWGLLTALLSLRPVKRV